MTIIKKGTPEEWKELGTLSKAIRDALFRAAHLSEKIMSVNKTNKAYRALRKATEWMDEFKNQAEEVMFRQGVINGTKDDLNVFYGERDDFKKVLNITDTETGVKQDK